MSVYDDVLKNEKFSKMLETLSKEEKEKILNTLRIFSETMEGNLLEKLKNIINSADKEEYLKEIKKNLKE